MLKFNMIGKPNDVVKQWAVYTMRSAFGDLQLLHVGVIKMTQLITFNDALLNENVDFDKILAIEIISLHPNKGLALRDALQLRAQNKMPIQLNPHTTTIRDVETGETFSSAKACAEQRGISISNLSNHLNRKPGFKTVKGKIYEKIV